jgi:hypothetical protein
MFKVRVASYKRGLTKAVKRALQRGPPSNPSSAMSSKTTAWGATSWPIPKGDANNAVLAAVATTSASCSTG